MKTTVFEWWKKQGGTVGELAEALNYSPHYLYHLIAGDNPITEGFKARCVLHLGDEARFLFFDDDATQQVAERYQVRCTESPQGEAEPL